MYKKLLIIFTIISLALILSSCDSGECKHLFMSETIVEPDCDNEGKTINQCLDCPFSFYSDIVSPLGHTLESKVVAPTCTEAGHTEYSCDCGYSYNSDFVPPANHEFTASVIRSKCNESGYTAYFCDCGYSYRAEYTPPLNHEYTESTIAPTCTTVGYTTHTCSICGSEYTDKLTAPLGHSITTETFFPTCLSGGHKLNTCSVCSYSYRSDYIFYSDIIESAFTDNTQILAKGLDVSKWNHVAYGSSYLPLDWKAIKNQGFDFVILKAGSSVRSNGTKGGIEPTFEADYAAAKAAGLDVGVYFYSYAHTVEEIEADAKALLQYIEGKKFEYPVYLDMEEESQETLGKDLLGDMCTEFISALQAEGYYAGIYLNNNWLKYILDRVEVTTLFDLWYARYPGTDLPVWNEESYGAQLGMWQFTEQGTIDGFSGYFDMNYVYRDYPAIMKQWGLNGY